jgi:heat shock protein HtpX
MPENQRVPQEPMPSNERTSFYDEIQRNKLKSTLLAALVLVVLFALIWVTSELFFTGSAVFFAFFALLISLAYVTVSYYYGDKIVLAETGAVELKPKTAKEMALKNLVESLSFAARLPAPKIYVIESTEMNAFATGRDPEHSSIAVTRALLEKMDRGELEGVIAHEMSHVSNYDIRFSLIVAVMVGMVAIMSDLLLRSYRFAPRDGEDRKGNFMVLVAIGFILALISPIIVRLVQASISRKRELLADASGAKLTRYPEGLASALEKIAKENQGNMKVSEAVSHLFFTDPVSSPLDSLFATHPPIQARIKLLREM